MNKDKKEGRNPKPPVSAALFERLALGKHLCLPAGGILIYLSRSVCAKSLVKNIATGRQMGILLHDQSRPALPDCPLVWSICHVSIYVILLSNG